MKPEYIVTIVACSLFLILFLIFIVVHFRRKKRNEELMRGIESAYADKNLVKMDYDCAVYDAETERLIAAKQQAGGQMTIDELMDGGEVSAVVDETVFKTVDTDGLEEITGNYEPDKE